MTPQPEYERKWLEIEELVRQTQGSALAGQFAAAVMHEINNPLEAVANLNFLIQREANDPARVRHFSALIEEQLRTLSHLARQTLRFYRGPEARETVAVASVAEAALRVHQNKIEAKRIHLQKDLPLGVTAEVHPGDMLQVLSNLVANAVDALPVEGKLQLRVKGGAHAVHITVADNGHGIPEPILTKIFDPFFTTKKERGTGLGLAISKAIVEKHHGRIRSRSSTRAPRCGTIFRISLPAATNSDRQ